MTTTVTTVPSTIDEALDKAADILEESGWVKHRCYDSKTGGHCALGAIAVPFYPDVNPVEIGELGWTDDYDVPTRHPLHLEAVDYFASTISTLSVYASPSRDTRVYEYNDQAVMSSERIVKKLREAAAQYRQEQAA